MGWSFRVARVSNIDIKIHATFFLIVLLFAFQWGVANGLAGAAFGSLLIILLFACVTLHELGHSITAQRFGIDVREIVLLPLGGVAILSRNPAKPMQDLLIAAAGPLVNVVIAIMLAVVLALTGDLSMLGASAMVQGIDAPLTWTTMLLWLLEANILLVIFNLIPAFPLDGGRILRAVLAMFIGQRRATRIASVVGQGFALLMGLYALLTLQFLLLLIAVFIFFGAGRENVEEQASTVLSTQRVGDAYNKYVLTLTIGDRISKVLDYILTSYQPDFAVLQGNRLLGIVTRDDVLNTLARSPNDSNILDVYVTTVMRREVVRVDANATLDEVRTVMGEQSARVVAVYEGETYLGLINQDDLAEAFTVLSFMERFRRRPPSGTTASAAEVAQDTQ
ncbi:MAG: site-2 protease family protein [Chloroflexaceae bacterium]|nr:site-2 protease family protein [Chloroflexaceae bacterium]NJO04458.1 site-2 protease family protein [Chloroflexaceae bacterium]